MNLLLKAALRARKHLSLLIITFFALIALTVASQMEMFTLGVISSKGSDFFTLFGDKGEVTKEQMQQRWDDIDTEKKGVISQTDAARYIGSRKGANPLQYVMYQMQKRFDLNNNIQSLIVLLVFVAVFKAMTLFFSRYTTQILSIRVSRDLREQYFQHIQKLPMSFYHKYDIGTLSNRVAGDASQIATSLNSFLTNYLQAPFKIVTTLLGCFYLSWHLSLVIFIGLPLVVLPIVFVTRRVRRITRQLQRNQEKFTSVLIDFLAGIQTVKIFAMEGFSFKKYKEQNDRMATLESKTAKYDLMTRPILHTITTICLATVVIYGLHFLQLSVSQLIVFCGLLHLFYEPVKKFAEENANIQKGVIAAERLFEVLNIDPIDANNREMVTLNNFRDAVEFKNVWFKYQEEWVLKNVSFRIKKGETVAIVGATGAGKSTIVQLLPRLYDIQKGDILIDGISIKNYTPDSLREQISFVSQKPFLFLDTVSANISFGRNFSKDKVCHAAKRAHAKEFIEELPNKYQTMLQEMGKNLSGGQQQRLAIARALAKEAPILILDEATSALDSISEKRIKDTISELHGEITQVIIAHRLTTIEHADRIIFLDYGQKIAEGTRDELMETCMPFKLMWDAHFSVDSMLKETTSFSESTTHAASEAEAEISIKK